MLQKEGVPTAVVSMPCRMIFEAQDAAYRRSVLGTSRARVAVEAAVEMGWDRYIGLEGRFVGMHGFGASGKIGDVYKKFDINAEAVVRAAKESLAEVAGPLRVGGVAAIRASRKASPGLQQVACFDTSFHRTMPRVARMLGLPESLPALRTEVCRRLRWLGLEIDVSAKAPGLVCQFPARPRSG